MKERGNLGGMYTVEGKGRKSPGEDVRKLSLLSFTPPAEILARAH